MSVLFEGGKVRFGLNGTRAILVGTSSITPVPTPVSTPVSTSTPTSTTAPGNTVTPSSLVVSFAGPAGAPTGAQVLTPVSGSSFAGVMLDGSGDILLPSANYQYGVLAAAPAVPTTGAITAIFKAGASAPFMLGRLDATGANGGYVVFFSDRTALVSRTNNVETVQAGSSVGITSLITVSLRMDTGGAWQVFANGQNTGLAFSPSVPVNGYAALGSSAAGQAVAVSSINYQTLSNFDAGAAANALVAATSAVGAASSAGVYGEMTPADGLARGIYGPSNATISGYTNPQRPTAAYFVRGMSGVTRMTLTGPQAALFNIDPGNVIYGNAGLPSPCNFNVVFDNSLSGGTDVLTMPVTFTIGDTGAASFWNGGCFVCDGQGSNLIVAQGGYVSDAAPSDPATLTIGGADAGLFQINYYGGMSTTAAAQPYSAHYGAHSLTVTKNSLPASAPTLFYILGKQSPRAKIIPGGQIYDTALAGDASFSVVASSEIGLFTYGMIGPASAYFTISLAGVATLNSTATLAGLAGTTLAGVVTVTSSGNTTYLPVSVPIAAGQTLPASAMTITVTSGLTDGTQTGQVATFVPPSSMTGAITYSLLQQPSTIEGTVSRFAVDGSAHTISNTNYLTSVADTQALIARSGGTVAVTPFTISAARSVGPVFECGPGQTYPLYANATSAVFEDSVGARTYGPGVTFRVHCASTPFGWFGEMNGGSAAYDRGHCMAYGGYTEPYNIVGVPDANGTLPLFGGDGAGYYGKGGVLLTGDRTVSVSNCEVTSESFAAASQAGIRDDFRQGDTIISNFYGHNCNNAYLGTTLGNIAINNILTLMCGDGSNGTTHNWYQDAVYMTGSHILTSGVNGGHSWKDRTVTATYSDSMFYEGLIGRNSSAIDMPNAGTRSFYRCGFMKGPMANNFAMIQYGRETAPGVPNQPRYIHNNVGATVYFEDCVFINHYGTNYNVGSAVAIFASSPAGAATIDISTGLPVKFVFVRCSQYGFLPNKFLVQGGIDNGGTTFPPGVTTLTEPPPLDYRSPLLNGAPVRQPAPWWTPNPQSYTGGSTNSGTGIIDPGVWEIRVAPSTAVGTQCGPLLAARGVQAVASSDPSHEPWANGAVWSVNRSDGPNSSAFFDITSAGAIHPTQSLTNAPVMHWILAQVTSANGAYVTDAWLSIVVSTTPARTDCIPAGLGPRILPNNQGALA